MEGRIRRRRLCRCAVFLEEGEDFRFRDLEAEGFHGDFELVVVDLLVFVEVEELELEVASILLAILRSRSRREQRTASLISSLCSSVNWFCSSRSSLSFSARSRSRSSLWFSLCWAAVDAPNAVPIERSGSLPRLVPYCRDGNAGCAEEAIDAVSVDGASTIYSFRFLFMCLKRWIRMTRLGNAC